MKKELPSYLVRPKDALSTKLKNALRVGEFERRKRDPNEALPNRDSVFDRPVWNGKIEDGSKNSL